MLIVQSELSNLKQLSLITVVSLEARDFIVSRD